MTPEEIEQVVNRMDDHARKFDRKNGTFRQFFQEQSEISRLLNEYADSNGEHAQLAKDAFNFACAGADADGLYLHVEELTQDHTPADQNEFLLMRRTSAKPLSELTQIELLAMGSLLLADLDEWVEAFNNRGKTYRDFWDEYAAASHDLDALLRFENLPVRVRELAAAAKEKVLNRGYEPSRLIPARSMDDPIYDPALTQ